MTCIVAIKQDDVIYMGADTLGLDTRTYEKSLRTDPKLGINGQFLIGFTTSYRMGQLLLHSLKVPNRKKSEEPYHYMVTTFVDAVRNCLKKGGYARKTTDGQEDGGTFLVGYAGELYEIDDDYQVIKPKENFAVIGCGKPYAYGSLYTTNYCSTDYKLPRIQINYALHAAEQYSAGVGGSFIYRAINKNGKEIKC